MNMIHSLAKQYSDLSICNETNEVKCFIKFHLLHENAMRKEIENLKSHTILNVCNIDKKPADFFNTLIKYEKKHAYKYSGDNGKKKYKTIYAVKIVLLLPKTIKKNSEIKELAAYFVSSINNANFKLPWVTYTTIHGEGLYLNILLSERECIGHYEHIKYNRNYYAKDGTLLHAKNEIKIDKNGKKIKEFVQFSSKRRIFILDQSIEKIRGNLINHFFIALKRCKRKIEFRFVIQKKKVNRFWHYFNRKAVDLIYQASSFIEFICNYAVDLQRDKIKNLLEDPHRFKSPPIPMYDEIKKVFFKYKTRLSKHEFHDQSGIIRKINYKHIPLNELRENIDVFIQMFKTEIETIIPGLFRI